YNFVLMFEVLSFKPNMVQNYFISISIFQMENDISNPAELALSESVFPIRPDHYFHVWLQIIHN
ncbi:MAG: hypothetical protein ACK56I_25105, partial [bacterium]